MAHNCGPTELCAGQSGDSNPQPGFSLGSFAPTIRDKVARRSARAAPVMPAWPNAIGQLDLMADRSTAGVRAMAAGSTARVSRCPTTPSRAHRTSVRSPSTGARSMNAANSVTKMTHHPWSGRSGAIDQRDRPLAAQSSCTPGFKGLRRAQPRLFISAQVAVATGYGGGHGSTKKAPAHRTCKDGWLSKVAPAAASPKIGTAAAPFDGVDSGQAGAGNQRAAFGDGSAGAIRNIGNRPRLERRLRHGALWAL